MLRGALGSLGSVLAAHKISVDLADRSLRAVTATGVGAAWGQPASAGPMTRNDPRFCGQAFQVRFVAKYGVYALKLGEASQRSHKRFGGTSPVRSRITLASTHLTLRATRHDQEHLLSFRWPCSTLHLMKCTRCCGLWGVVVLRGRHSLFVTSLGSTCALSQHQRSQRAC